MKQYAAIHEKYCSLIEKCIESSQNFADIPSPSGAHFYASILFTKMCTYSVSIKKLSPDPCYIGKEVHWDFGSVASLTRNLIECYLSFFYLCIETCPEEEWDARWKLMNLHDHTSRTKMFESLGEDTANDPKTIKISAKVANDLSSNKWFSELPENRDVIF